MKFHLVSPEVRVQVQFRPRNFGLQWLVGKTSKLYVCLPALAVFDLAKGRLWPFFRIGSSFQVNGLEAWEVLVDAQILHLLGLSFCLVNVSLPTMDLRLCFLGFGVSEWIFSFRFRFGRYNFPFVQANIYS
jgi:hypothetical protein